MFALHRFLAVLMKEFVQMRRDRLTFAMMIGVPVMQLVLFGYAINMDPKALPAAVVTADSSPFSRSPGICAIWGTQPPSPTRGRSSYP